MLTPDQQSRRAVLIASIENALEFHQHVLELRELLELERKDATTQALTGPSPCCDECSTLNAGCAFHGICACHKTKGKAVADFEDEPTKERRPQPCLDETKMHGYCDQFGGSDDPNDGFTGELIPNLRTCGVARARAEEPEWRRALMIVWQGCFMTVKPAIEEMIGVTESGQPVRRTKNGPFEMLCSDEEAATFRAIWPLEQLRRNVLAKSPTIVLPEEVAALMPGDYVVPSGTYNRDELEENNWIYQGNLDGSSVEESTERILAAIDKRGAQILAGGSES